jgi:ABC-type ATPase with predicted acetyltransferase domain
MPPSRREKQVVSVWRCATCGVQVVIQGQPRRQRHGACQRWMAFVRTYTPRPAWSWPKPR